jgi:hypothetical protein
MTAVLPAPLTPTNAVRPGARAIVCDLGPKQRKLVNVKRSRNMFGSSLKGGYESQPAIVQVGSVVT